VTVARIAAVTRRHARRRALTGAEQTAALTELAAAADGRVDPLAQHAGLAVGFHERDSDAPIYLQIAQLCIEAGADTALTPRWIAEGRPRAAARQFPPPD
jgi:hypothetical protein